MLIAFVVPTPALFLLFPNHIYSAGDTSERGMLRTIMRNGKLKDGTKRLAIKLLRVYDYEDDEDQDPD